MPEKIRSVVIQQLSEAGISQRELARRSGVDRVIIGNYLAGKTEITTATLARLLAVFGKTIRAVKRDAGK